MPYALSHRWIVIVSFVAAVLLLCLTGAAVVDVLSATRAYVSGESLYSKGQKDAVFHLWRYGLTHDEADFERFRAAIALPIGDRHAREELEKASPDLQRVRDAFLRGGNHPDDLDGLIRLYRYARDVPFMARSLEIWAEGDGAISELDGLAARLHDATLAGAGGSAEAARLLAQLPRLNDHLTSLEQRFSETLGEASRAVQWISVGITLGVGALLIAAGVALMSRLLQRQASANRALRESHARWELAAEAAGIGVLEWNEARGTATLDTRAAAMCGLGAGGARDVEDRALARRIHADDVMRLNRSLAAAQASAGSFDARFRMEVEPGRESHLEVAAKVETVAIGGRRVVGILRDVSVDVQREQLRLDKEAAERASSEKSVFLSRVSHELRTPLNAVLGFAQLLQNDTLEPLTRTQEQRVGHVLDSGNHLLALIDDVLELTRIEQREARPALGDVDLAEALRASIAEILPMAQSHQVLLQTALPANAQRAHGDAKWLRQVFSNLLSNAIKYNRRHGRVDVVLQRAAGRIDVSVRDTGIGMTAAQVAALYQPFNRLGAERSKVPGHGLGLVIARQLLERMGATLEVESEEGQGSTFTARFATGAAAARASSQGVSAMSPK